MDKIDNDESKNELYDWLYGLYSCLKKIDDIDIEDEIDQLEDCIKD